MTEVKKTVKKVAPAAPAAKPAASPSMKLMKSKKAAPVAEEQVEATEEAVETSEQQELGTPATPVVEADMIVKTVHEIENMKEDKAFKLVPTLMDTIDHDYFRLGGVLALIQTQGWYMDKGHDNFKSFIENDCGMAYRKCLYLVQIYNGLVASGVTWDQVKELGWTKLKELAGILTTENVDEWVEMASNMTVLQLQEYIKSQTAGVSKGDSAAAPEAEATEAKKTTTMTFKMHEDQKQTVREALDKSKHESGTDVDTVALENICLNFLGGEIKLPSLAELMKSRSAEEVLGVFSEVFPEVVLTAEVPE